jgi:hypothetical protein
MTQEDLTLLVIAKNAEDMRKFKLDHVEARETILHINYDRSPLSGIANWYLKCDPELILFGLVHADMDFGPGALDIMCETAESMMIAGTCGRELDPSDIPDGYVWSKFTRPGPVSTLDSSCVFFRTDLGLEFDEETFDGFHLHVEDLCLQAAAKGLPVVVPQCDAVHSSPDKNGTQWYADRDRYWRKLKAKWPNVRFATT